MKNVAERSKCLAVVEFGSVGGPVLHLVSPRSGLKPLCGDDSADAKIGSYFEHLHDGEWVREVVGEHGIAGVGCAECLAKHPSLQWEPQRLIDYLKLQFVTEISPYPREFRDEFNVKAYSISGEYVIDPEPTVTGQYVIDGKVALTLITHVVPTNQINSRRRQSGDLRAIKSR